MAENGKWRLWAHGLVLLVLGLTALSVVAALRARAVERQLLAADAAMSDNPRRALALLDSLDADCLCGRAQQAKYALLYTQAQDKNYIDETNDSLIRVASEYYESRGSVRDRFRALYYRGRICVNRGEYSRAMIAFMEAELLVRDLHDDYLAGLLYAQMGDIYKHYYDYPKALRAYEMTYAHYLNTNRELHQYHAMIDIALVYMQLEEYAKCESILRQVLSFAFCQNRTILKEVCYGNLIILLNEQQRFSESALLFNRWSAVGCHIQNTSMWASEAYRYASSQDTRMAQCSLQHASDMVEDTNDSLQLFYYKALVSYQARNYSDAYNHIVKSIKLQDSLLRHALQQPILSTQRDVLTQKLQY